MKNQNIENQSILVERINNLCKEQRMSYYALSYKSAVPMSTLINIVNYKTNSPGIDTVWKISSGLGISLKEFFNTSEFDKIDTSFL